jgi:IS4 transposase
VKDLLEEADDRLFVRDAMLDRGFYGTLYAQAMKETGVHFVVRAQLGYKSKKMWENAEDGVNVERVTMSRSYAPYESVEVTRFVVPAREDADAEYMSFITDRELTERQARRIGRAYKRRWGIETSYRVINDFLPKTASKDVGLRVWYYRMGVLLYNVWVLVNGVVAKSLDLDSGASPPVTAKYMLTVLISKHGDQSIT